MRTGVILLPLLISATPARAQPAAARPVETFKIPPELTDPRTTEKLDRTMQAMTNVLLSLPVGEIEAVAEGRKPTSADRKLTIRDLGRRNDPNFERNLRRQVAEAGPKVAQGMQAIGNALPSITKALDDASRAIDRAAANMPDPTYPKR
jgi:hypothetical protein